MAIFSLLSKAYIDAEIAKAQLNAELRVSAEREIAEEVQEKLELLEGELRVVGNELKSVKADAADEFAPQILIEGGNGGIETKSEVSETESQLNSMQTSDELFVHRSAKRSFYPFQLPVALGDNLGDVISNYCRENINVRSFYWGYFLIIPCSTGLSSIMAP